MSPFLVTLTRRLVPPGSSDARCRGDAGQTTAEYALILIAAASIAVLVISWATKTDAIGKLFDLVLSHVTGSAT